MSTNMRPATGLFLPALFSFLSLLFYGPATYWLVNETLGQEQLMHAFIILALAGAYILNQRKDRITLSFDFGPSAIRCLVISFVIVGISALLHWPLLIIPAYALALLGWLLFIFGDRLSKTLVPIMTGFGVYLLLIFLLPYFDWPLRYMAGRYAITLLYYLGYQVQLFYASGQEPKLILDNNGNIFEVAAECNGFGVLGGCLLLTILLVTFGRVRWLDRLLAIGISVLVAISANLGRIVVICALAPGVGKESYDFMHELVGTIFFWSALIVVWFVSHQLFPKRKEEGTEPRLVLFFDGQCGLCYRSMKILQSIDVEERLGFASLESKEGEELRVRHPEIAEVDSILLVEHWHTGQEHVSIYSDAVLKAMKHIGGLWSIIYLAVVVPRPIRDHVYRWIARHRRKWFGGPEACDWRPGEGLKRYIE
jgi:exosortase/archaeosortase family protein